MAKRVDPRLVLEATAAAFVGVMGAGAAPQPAAAHDNHARGTAAESPASEDPYEEPDPPPIDLPDPPDPDAANPELPTGEDPPDDSYEQPEGSGQPSQTTATNPATGEPTESSNPGSAEPVPPTKANPPKRGPQEGRVAKPERDGRQRLDRDRGKRATPKRARRPNRASARRRSRSDAARSVQSVTTGPSPTPSTNHPSASSGQAAGSHVVRSGEPLWSIAAARLGPSAGARAIAAEVKRLWTLNAATIGTGDPNVIYPGQRLRI